MNKIALKDTESGEVVIHAVSGDGSNYATICGCSEDDDQFERVECWSVHQISCKACRGIFNVCKQLRIRDFAP